MVSKNDGGKFKANWEIKTNTSFASVMDFINNSSTDRRSLVEEALVNYYFPEAVIQNDGSISIQEIWHLQRAIAELETRVKLYRSFIPDSAVDLGSLSVTLPNNHVAETIEQITTNYSDSQEELEEAIVVNDDDDFGDGGI